MYKNSVYKISILSIFFSLFFYGVVSADASAVKIAILPFELSASSPNEQLLKKIPLQISQNLEQEGTQVVMPEPAPDFDTMDFQQIRKIGIQTGVDYILTGTVFVAGQSISIDTMLYNIYDDKKSFAIYSHAANVENLFSAVTRLGKEITGILFKRQIIINIAIEGNLRIESDAILRTIDVQTGDIFKADLISKDLRKIYKMGYFDNVVVEKQTLDSGVKIIFKVTEKATVRKVGFKRNTIFKDKELSDIVTTRTGSILNMHKLNADVDRLRLMYTEKNYHNCVVTYEITPLERSQSDIIFSIEEGNKLRVESITFKGNQYFSDKKLKKAMETSEKGLFAFLSLSGDLNEIEVKNDAIRIESLYKNNGFIDAKVSDPDVQIGEESITVHFDIKEGDQFTVNQIDIKGDLILDKDTLFEMIHSEKDRFYNRKNIRKDINTISDAYANEGFAKVDIQPLVDKLEDEKKMNITYVIDKGPLIYFNRVNISGNLKTRDKVVRREIKVIEQDTYSKKNIQLSYKNLNRLNYFEEIDIQPQETSEENQMDLNIRVKERQTGSLSFGGGFSSSDGAYFTGSIEERNLFGNGQTIKFEARIGEEDTSYDISFFEPYILDSNLSGGVGIYKRIKEYDYYDKDSLGLSLKLGYRLFDYTKIGARYYIEDYKISDVVTDQTYMTSGSFLTSGIVPYILYDSRDDFFLPTEGFKHKLSVEYAGEYMGGEIDFIKVLAETGVAFPLFWKFTGILHAEAGYIDDRTNSDINIDHVKFYLGGMRSIRGFDKYDINASQPGETRQRGGEKYVQFNAEMTFPFTEKYRVAWVFFYDRGDVYEEGEDIDLADQFSSVGMGLRWNSPVGPIRLEYGWVIDGKDVKDTGDGQFDFSVGASF